jgi:protein-L-isoaspartate(D-aspartate) O-methyltransferase
MSSIVPLPEQTGAVEVRDDVEQAMRAVPRKDFLPPDVRGLAGEDRPLPIGEGQTSSQPRTVAAMLRLLDVRRGHRVLDVGAGSGWTTALLARLVGPDGSVTGVELSPGLARWGAANLAGSGQPWASLRQAAPRELGAPDDAPFDRVLVSAEGAQLPQALVDQLAPGGLMVVPVAGVMLRVARGAQGAAQGAPEGAGASEVTVSRHGSYRFVPLR